MKAFLTFALLVFLIPATAAAETLSRELSVDPAAVRLDLQDGLTRVTLPGGGDGVPAGAPDLPLVGVVFPLPPGTRPVGARLIPLDIVALPGTHRLPAAGGNPEVPYAGSENALLPTDPVVAVHPGRMRGRGLVSVAVSPVRWDPATGELRLASRFRVEVDVENAPPDPGAFVPVRETTAGAAAFDRAYRSLVGTAPAVPGRRVLTPAVNSGAPFAPTYRPSVNGSAVEMVIITTADQASEYQRLADFKTRTGIPTVVRTVDWIIANYPQGADPQETIRNFIRDAAAQWGTVWVLLGGDSGEIPIRYAWSTYGGGRNIPCDLYYSDLDGNWNADGDAKFGEAAPGLNDPGDAVDLYPDVWVGRLPSNDAADAQVLVDKTLHFEQNPPLGYQRDALILAEVLSPDDWDPGEPVGLDGASIGEAVADSLLPQQHGVRLYENYTAFPGALPETRTAVIDSINAGYQLVQHIGHGFINTMSIGLGHTTLTNVDVDGFTNGDRTFLLCSLNCTSSAFQYNSIAERFLLNPGGGAVGSIGTTEVDYPSTALLYQGQFYHLLLRGGVNQVGEALALCRVPYVASSIYDSAQRWTQFSLVYMGDPSLTFWLDVPGTLTVTHPSSFTLGQASFSVTVKRGGIGVPGARVTLDKAGDDYATAITDGSGQAVIPFHPDLAGTVSVGVWTGSDLPYLGSASVVTPFSTYLYPVSQTVNDTPSAPTSGNGDGLLDAGETADLRFTLKNAGITPATSVSATLSTSDPYLSLVDPTSAFPDLGSGVSQLASDPMRLVVSDTVPDRHEAHATLAVTTSAGSFSKEVILYLHAPIVELHGTAVRDTVGNGNGNGTVEANEDFALLPTVRNLGLGAIRGAELRLRSADPAVTITDSVAVLGDVPAGGIAVNPADGLAARFSDVNSPHSLRLVVIDAYGEIFSRSVDVTPPGPVGAALAEGHTASIDLTWDPVPDPDLWGYAIYRSPVPTGPYTRINSWAVLRTSYFEDTGLPAFTPFYYRIAAIDSSGNQGALSDTVAATTTLPVKSGWPVEMGTQTPGGVALADLDGLPGLEVLAGGKEIYALTASGGEVADGDQDARTLGPITQTGGARFWNTPAVGDLDGDGRPDVVSVGFDDALVHAVDRFGQPLSGWPRTVNPGGLPAPNPVGSVTLGDLDADGRPEVVVTVGRTVFAWHGDGTEVVDGDNNPATDGVFAVTGSDYSYGTPAVASIDGGPYREVIVGMRDHKLYVFRGDGSLYPGFPYVAGGDICMGPAVGDIDGDGRPEIVFGSGDGMLYAMRADLSLATGFPQPVPLAEDWDSSPALGDVNGDGFPDIAIGSSDGRLFVISGKNGAILPGFPVSLLDPSGHPVATRSAPALADVDGDGSVDIVIGDRSGGLHAFNAAGISLPGFPIVTGNRIEGGPAVGDIDGDGLTEVVAESEDQFLYVWDSPWPFNPGKAPWPMFMGNPGHTGALGDAGYQGAVTGIPDAVPGPVLAQNVPNPFHASTVIRYRIADGEGPQNVTLRIYDVSGRLVRVLVDARRAPGEYDAPWDGKDDRALSVAAGIYAYRLVIGTRAVARTMVVLPR